MQIFHTSVLCKKCFGRGYRYVLAKFPLKILNAFINAYISIFRGVPLLLQITFVYFSLPKDLGGNATAIITGCISFSLNSSAYLFEIFRGGSKAIDSKQYEAASLANVGKWRTYKDIVIPKLLYVTTPSLVNEVISLTKETSLLSVVGVYELTRRSSVVANLSFNFISPLLVSSMCYYFISYFIAVIGKSIEKKISRSS